MALNFGRRPSKYSGISDTGFLARLALHVSGAISRLSVPAGERVGPSEAGQGGTLVIIVSGENQLFYKTKGPPPPNDLTVRSIKIPSHRCCFIQTTLEHELFI